MSAIVEFDIDEQVMWYFWDAVDEKNIVSPMSRVEEIKPGTLSGEISTWLLSHSCSNYANGNTMTGEGCTILKFDIELHCKSVTIFASKPEKYGEPYLIHSMWEIQT